MTEQHEIYRVTGNDIQVLVTQLNWIFNQLCNRVDQIEGLRGTPELYTTEINYPGQSVSGFLKGSADSADYSTISLGDLSGNLLSLDEGYLKIEDSNGTVIHQIGDTA